MGRGKKRRPGKGGGGRGRGPSQSRYGDDRPLPGLGAFQVTRTEAGPGRLAGEDFQVHDVAPGQATKWYRCPGCDQEIPPGVAHVVAWPSDYGGRADDRRHWHRNCWGKRGDRGITRRWG